jgi:hypothetical protein
MQTILKILLVPLFWLLFLLVLQINYPHIYGGIMDSLRIKEIRFKVSGGLNADYPRSLLTENRNALYWLFFSKKIQQAYAKDLLFESVSLERCEFFNFFCYQVEVFGREPSLIQFVGKRSWLVDSHGTVIRPITLAQAEAMNFNLPRVVLLPNGVSLSPQVVAARRNFALRLLSFLEKLGLRGEELFFDQKGELVLKLKNYSFEVVLEFKPGKYKRLHRQLDRLKFIINDLGEAHGAVKKIDLAFERQAVITPKESEPSLKQ